MRLLATLAGLLAAFAAPAAAEDFIEITTQQEIDQALREAPPEVRKNFDRFKDKLKRLERKRREQPDVDERSLEAGMNDPDLQSRDAERVGNARPDVQDLVSEYLEEKRQSAEESFWVVAEEKATPETRPVYRNYLRQVYFHGTARDGNAAAGLARLRQYLDMDEGWRLFPTLNTGEVPPGAAGVYFGGRRHISLVDPNAIVVFSHEMWHFWDDDFGGIDGSIAYPFPGVEPLAYGLMGTELGGGGSSSGGGDAQQGGSPSGSDEEDSAEDAASFDLVCSLR